MSWITYIPVGEHLTTTDLSSVVTLDVPGNANGVIVQAEIADVRLKIDGTNPTASDGFLIRAGEPERAIPVVGGTPITLLEANAGAVLQHQFVKVYPA